MKLILILLSLIATDALAKRSDNGIFFGVMKTNHVISEGLNEFHLAGGAETDQYGMIFYRNSFEQMSFGLYYKYEDMLPRISRRVQFSTKLGILTGYQRQMEYGDRIYDIGGIFLQEEVMLMAVPSIDYIFANTRTSLELAGDAVSLSFRIFVN